ncbi:ferredoxin [Microbispora hainanensis]|jgi:ferredoxin|uniref:ferredoxin n=1 Tax=Microbispora TaxID=2005 RepID=UPI001157FBE9|nr:MULTISPECIES: ferredoxin [Microbispora]NJP25233.1 ferredoxin [Microbispora sp. CL1-1]TQS13688.1 ferredoxin [Microbispora sp. SCL1-1]
MKVTADRSRCMAAGHCAISAPDVFDHGEDGLVVVLDAEPGEQRRREVEVAEDLCPSRAIAILRTAAVTAPQEAGAPDSAG